MKSVKVFKSGVSETIDFWRYQILGFASEVPLKALRLLGLQLTEVTDNEARVRLPHYFWTSGLVLSAAELAVNALLRRHFAAGAVQLKLNEWRIRQHAPMNAGLTVVFSWPGPVREPIINTLFQQGEVQFSGEALAYFDDQRLAVTAEFDAVARASLALSKSSR